MKSYLLMFLAVASFPLSLVRAADEKPQPDAVVVKVLDVPLPHDEEKKTGFLWTMFANKPDEQKFNSYTTEKWKENFGIFAKALIQKANEQKLDSTSLRKAIDLVLKNSKGQIAYLPVGAYQTTLDNKPVWIVTVKWESSSMEEAKLGHIRVFAFDQKSLKQVGFSTCM